MLTTAPLIIAKNSQHTLAVLPALANRHGLITGATGTGKTVTLQKMAEQFSRAGIPVFLADVKGDLSGIAAAAEPSEKLSQRLAALGVDDWTPQANPVLPWDIYGEQGHPVRATISDFGPVLLARLLGLNDVQSGILNLVFKIADDNQLLLLDLKDLRAMVQFVGDNAKNFATQYGHIAAASIGAIQRSLLTLEQQGAEYFFGEPMLAIDDLMRHDAQGRGMISLLSAEKLIRQPRLYAAFLLWMLSELFEQLPEVGDQEKPKLIFFFDEAHLLFHDASPALLEKIEQVVRLIRSKGVGVYFVTQNPSDIPETILGQLGNRVQHALRAFTPRDQKAVKAAAQTLRPNPALNTEQVITELGVGEALISFLDAQGRPAIVERANVIAPESRMGPLRADERNALINHSPLYGRYEELIDRESAYERLTQQTAAVPDATPSAAQPEKKDSDLMDNLNAILFGKTGPRGGKKDGLVQTVARQAARQLGNELGRRILRGVLGGILGGRK